MAKRQRDIENPMLTAVIPLKRPEKEEKVESSIIKCGCGKPATYEVYEDGQPHCDSCFYEAMDDKTFIQVRRLYGGFDDAS